MRFPFDLICAVLLMDGMERFLIYHVHTTEAEVLAITPEFAALVWAGFFLVAWLAHEWVVRGTEWRTAFGRLPAGRPSARRHPLEIHTWTARAAQALTVAAYGLALWTLKWPLWTTQWPEWAGLDEPYLGRLPLARSSLASMMLNLTPFLVAMLIAWLPRRRLAEELSRRRIPLLKFIGYEARLTWIPLAVWLVLSLANDAAQALPSHYTHWLSNPGVDVVASNVFLALLALIGLPTLVLWLWECRPLPDGELKTRLETLMRRSNVKARSILVWGPRGSGLLNACVLGPWSRFRYVLISPALVDELSLEETEAVLAHELGHVKYGHLTLLFVMILCMSALVDPIAQALSSVWHVSPLMQVAAIMVFILVYMAGFFGTIMRQCEREADLASAEMLGTPQPLVSALEKLALITGNIRNIYCWHHGSIAERVASVQKLSTDAAVCENFHHRQRRVRILFTTLTIVAIVAQFVTRLLDP